MAKQRTEETEPLRQFADQLETDLQKLDEELLQEKVISWEKKLGGNVSILLKDPTNLIKFLLHDDWECREIAVQMLGTFHWQTTATGLLLYIARHDPHVDVRCSAIEEIGNHLIQSEGSDLRSYLAEIILSSNCKETVLTAYINFVASLPSSLDEIRTLPNLTYEGIDWEQVKLHRIRVKECCNTSD